MSLGCISPGGTEPPDVIVDTTTLSVSLDNNGLATLSVSILRKNIDAVTNPCMVFTLSNGSVFRGYIDSDTISNLQGTDYYEHNIIALGSICA